MQPGYVVRETGSNLRRNLMMSFAAILTVAVSLSLVGGALLVRQGVANATYRWRGGTELSIYMNPDATQTQIDAIKSGLDNSPEVKRVTFVDKDAAFEEAKKVLAESPDSLQALSPPVMPTSFRVVPNDTKFIAGLKGRFADQAGVMSVRSAEESIGTMLRITRVLQVGLFIVAVLLLGSASLLILNTIRIAIFARRREVSVMKLVGATNWFIRVPFMLEGFLQGLLGALLAVGAVLGIRALLTRVSNSPDFTLLNQVGVTFGQALGTGVAVLVVGVLVGVGGSLVAVHRFLEA